MAGVYTVKQGDHLAKIADAFGFSDYHAIWDDPNNADLKQQRKNPNVLYPGDSVYIPDLQTREESRPTDQTHAFVMKTVDLKLRLILSDQYEKPIANAPCILSLEGSTCNLTTDGTGKIELNIRPTIHNATLVIQDAQTPFNNAQLAIKIGDLDPTDQVSGQAARLINLGYFTGDVKQPDPEAFESAVEEFQCDQGLTVDGICGPASQSALKRAHGC